MIRTPLQCRWRLRLSTVDCRRSTVRNSAATQPNSGIRMMMAPMRPKQVTLIAAAALTTGWLLASVVSPPVAELQVLPLQVERAAAPPSAGSATYTEQLHLKLRSAPQPPVPRRNPFAFDSPRQRSASVDRSAPPRRDAAAIELPQPAIVTGPSFRLSGIGSTNSPAGPIWSAVISDGRT